MLAGAPKQGPERLHSETRSTTAARVLGPNRGPCAGDGGAAAFTVRALGAPFGGACKHRGCLQMRAGAGRLQVPECLPALGALQGTHRLQAPLNSGACKRPVEEGRWQAPLDWRACKRRLLVLASGLMSALASAPLIRALASAP